MIIRQATEQDWPQIYPIDAVLWPAAAAGIRLGIHVPNFGAQSNAPAHLSWTRFAESNGFAAIVMSDHVAPTSEVTDVYPPPFYDPLTAIAWLAGQSQDLLFATSVLVVPYRHPLLTARVSAMLHEISGGRFALGVGVGWSATEFQALGADYARRGQITDDYLQVITTAWRQRHIDAGLAGLRITVRHHWAQTRPTVADPSLGRRLGLPGHPACRPVRHRLAPDQPRPRLAAAHGAARPAPGEPAKRRLECQASCPGSSSGRRPHRSNCLARRSASVRSPRSPRTSSSSPDVGAEVIILDPNPDTPRPRDYACERNDLLRSPRRPNVTELPGAGPPPTRYLRPHSG